LGIKIICVGKWKKTNTGRKQKIYLKYGQIQSSNIANKILYHNISQTTKFGVCSIKIWVAHKI
jgi:ribosomal protein S3